MHKLKYCPDHYNIPDMYQRVRISFLIKSQCPDDKYAFMTRQGFFFEIRVMAFNDT